MVRYGLVSSERILRNGWMDRMKKNVLFLDMDGYSFPNLALMKLSSDHLARGDKCFLGKSKFVADKIYVGVVFSWNSKKAWVKYNAIKSMGGDVELGGYFVNSTESLSPEIEHTMPDYELYGMDYSMGFTSRGCSRNCKFCIVRQKEGDIRWVASINEFLHPDHKRLLLLDNNLLASPKWDFTLNELVESGVSVDYNQGLDIRLVDEKKAGLLAETNYECLRFSFDSTKMKTNVINGLNRLEEAGVPPSKTFFYVLVGFDTSFQEDMKRLKLLKDHGASAFPMVYKPITTEAEGVFPKGNIETFLECVGHVPRYSFYKLAKFYGIYDPSLRKKRGQPKSLMRFVEA